LHLHRPPGVTVERVDTSVCARPHSRLRQCLSPLGDWLFLTTRTDWPDTAAVTVFSIYISSVRRSSETALALVTVRWVVVDI